MRKDGRKGMTEQIIACHNFAKGPKFASLCTFWDDLKQKNHVAAPVELYKLS
jgi:hypothetical protein